MRRSDVTVLDCTLRDGGYYTNWEFGRDFVAAYLWACQMAGVDVVELGYIGIDSNNRGPFASLPGKVVSDISASLSSHMTIRFAAMLDASEALGCGSWQPGGELFGGLPTLPIDLIRVAVRFSALSAAMPIVRGLKATGLEVGVNLMQIDLASESDMARCLSEIVDMDGGVEVVYIADSLGGMFPERVRELCTYFRTGLPDSISLGFHAHDNLGLALHNGLTALDSGASWLDATMCGMGRGAGNARTELLLTVLRGVEGSALAQLYEFVASYLGPLHEEKRWGTSPLYAVAGVRAIHPTYVQLLMQDRSLDMHEKFEVLARLSTEPASVFRPERLHIALAGKDGISGGVTS